MRIVIVLTFLLSTLQYAATKPSDVWNDSDPELREWYSHVMRPEYPEVSCCGAADAYWTDDFDMVDGELFAIITDDRVVPRRPDIPWGTKIAVRKPAIKSDGGNPTGHGIIFITSGGYVLCYLYPALL